MNDLVALALPAGPEFIDELRRCWDDGDAVLPVDLRLPAPARKRLISALAPARVVEPGGVHAPPGAVPVEPGDALVVATSGTTGDPRGVVLTHDAVAASARASSSRLDVDPADDRWLACLPLSHVGGLSVVCRAIVTGTSVEVHDGFDPDAVTDAVRRGATLTSMVPTMLGRVATDGFRRVLLGGSSMPPGRAANTVATYGLTETGSGVVYEHVPLDGVEVRVVDGQIGVRGPMLLRCYRDGIVPTDDDGWLPTGDGGSFVDGRLEVFGRIGDMIVSGGENVWPLPVESILARHDAIADVAVVGRSDPEWGQVVTAVVVVADGRELPAIDELRELVRAELPAYCAPRRLEAVAALPRTALGKIRRSAVTT